MFSAVEKLSEAVTMTTKHPTCRGTPPFITNQSWADVPQAPRMPHLGGGHGGPVVFRTGGGAGQEGGVKQGYTSQRDRVTTRMRTTAARQFETERWKRASPRLNSSRDSFRQAALKASVLSASPRPAVCLKTTARLSIRTAADPTAPPAASARSPPHTPPL
ncbi:hypothetical protein CRUP_031150 [Coryphaenoides rupestris]|nr:hypothetical protein CRUP_031150 [Coryphaenoides rupestris]